MTLHRKKPFQPRLLENNRGHDKSNLQSNVQNIYMFVLIKTQVQHLILVFLAWLWLCPEKLPLSSLGLAEEWYFLNVSPMD
jgi:hypothetical protein